MSFKYRIREVFSELLISTDIIASYKEKSVLNVFVELLDIGEDDLLVVESNNRKNCIYFGLDLIIKDFCTKRCLDENVFKGIIFLSSIMDIYLCCYFWRFGEIGDKLYIDKVLSDKGLFTNRLVNLLLNNGEEVYKIFKIEDKDILKRLLRDMLIIRYTFRSRFIEYKKENKKWLIVLDKKLLERVVTCGYINKDVREKKSIIRLEKDSIIKNIIENSSFNKDIWINKFNLIKKDTNVFKVNFLGKKCEEIYKVLEILNFLNNSKFLINKELIKLMINNKEFMSELRDKKKYMTVLALEESLFLSNFSYFRFDFLMDNRTRIYIKNIPLNIQLEKVLRPLVINKIDSDFEILKKYKEVLDEVCDIAKIEDVFNVLKEKKEVLVCLINFVDKGLKKKK